MHKHVRLGGSGSICSPRRFLEIRCSMIASEAILGQKQSHSSYMACGVLYVIFGCARMHLLTGGVTSLGRQLVNCRLVSNAWNSDLFMHIFTCVLSPQQRKQLTCVFRAGPPRTNCIATTKLVCTAVILNTAARLVGQFQMVGHLKCTVKRAYKIFGGQRGFEWTPSSPLCLRASVHLCSYCIIM